MENFKILKERIITCITCDERQCPSIKERFHNHVRSHHSPRRSTVNQKKPAISIENQTFKSHISFPSYSRETSTTNLEMKKVSSQRNRNVENLKQEILEWSKELPIYFNSSFEDLKQNTINELIVNLSNFALDANQKNNNRLEHEIDKCINSLPLTTEEYNQLKINLINRITITVNNVSQDYAILNSGESEKTKEKSLKDESTNVPKFFYETTGGYSIDCEDIIGGQNSYVDVLTDRNTSKVLIKPTLIDSKLDNISMVDNGFNTQIYKSWTSIQSQLKETPKCTFRNYVQDKISYQLKVAGVYSDDLYQNIIDIFNTELVPDQLEEQKVKVIKLLKKSTALSVDHIDKIADYISHKLKMYINENISVSKSALCDVSVYRSQHDLHKYNVLSLASMRKSNESREEAQNIKVNENMYRKNIAAEIKSWINTLPTATENKHWKEVPTKSLINDLVEHLKIDQLMLETKTNKENCMFFFIMRWLNRIEYFKDLKDAKPYVYDLIERLGKMSVPSLAKKEFVDINKNEKHSINESCTSTSDVEILGNEIKLWLTEKSSYMQHKVKTNKLNQMINKLSKSICDHITKKSSQNAISKEISQWLSKIIKPEMKGDTKILSDNLKDRLYTLFDTSNNTFDKEPAFVNEQKQPLISTVISEHFKNMFKDLVRKYVDVLSEEENLLAKDLYKNIFINKINSMLGTNNLLTHDSEKLLAKKLNNELRNIEIVSDWLEINPIKDLSKKLSSQLRCKLVIDISDILSKKNEDSPKITVKSSSNLYETLTLDDLPLTVEEKEIFLKCVNKLTNEVALKNQNAVNSNYGHLQKQNRNEVIEEYIYSRREYIINDELKFDCIIDGLFKGMDATNDNIQQVDIKLFSNELDFAKEICHWLNNLPLLSMCDKDAYVETLKVVSDFTFEIIELFYPTRSTYRYTDEDVNKCLISFILKLPLNPKKEIDVQLAAQQLKKRFERIYKRNREPNNQSNKCSRGTCSFSDKSYEKELITEKYDASVGITQAIEEWLDNLPIKENNESSNRHLKQRVIRNLLQKLDELIMNPESFNHSFQYRNVLNQEIDAQLQHFVLQDITPNNKEALKKQLVDEIMENINLIKEKGFEQEHKTQMEQGIYSKTYFPEGAIIQTNKAKKPPDSNQTVELDRKNKTSLNGHAFSIPTCCKRQSTPKNPAEHIIKIVKEWCQELPLPENTHQEKENAKIIRDDVFVKIITKISELNINPETFNENNLYDTLLEDELNSILSTLPTCFELINSKTIRINQLKAAIKHVNTLINKDKERYEYKQKVKNAVEEILKSTDAEPANTSFTNLCDEIVDAFIEHNYYEDIIDKTAFENTIHDNISKYNGYNKEKDKYFLLQHDVDKILQKLSDIPSPSKSLLREDVQEIRLKTELKGLLDDLLQPESNISLKKQIIPVLAKRLTELLKQDPSFENQLIMRNEIIKCLKKFDEKIDTNKVNSFVEKLNDPQPIRKNSTLAYKKYNRKNEIPDSYEAYQEPLPHISTTSKINKSNNWTERDASKENNNNAQWHSLPPASLLEESNTNNKNKTQKTRDSTDSTENGFDYKDFEKGINLRSSLTENAPNNKKQKGNYQTFNSYKDGYDTAEDKTYDSTSQSTDQESKYLKFEKGINFISPSIENIPNNKKTLHPISEGTENELNNLEFEKRISQRSPQIENVTNNKQQKQLHQTSVSCENQTCIPTKMETNTNKKILDRSEIPDVSYHRTYKYDQYKNNEQSFPGENNKWKLSQELNSSLGFDGKSLPSHVRRTSSQTQSTSNNDRPLKRTYEYGKSYRKPSITLIAPKNNLLETNNYTEKKQTRHQKDFKNEIAIYKDNEVDTCDCDKIREQLNKNPCLERRRKICSCCKTCCDGVPPRYSGFHYY